MTSVSYHLRLEFSYLMDAFAMPPAHPDEQALELADHSTASQALEPANGASQALEPADDASQALEPADDASQARESAEGVSQALEPAVT